MRKLTNKECWIDDTEKVGLSKTNGGGYKSASYFFVKAVNEKNNKVEILKNFFIL